MRTRLAGSLGAALLVSLGASGVAQAKTSHAHANIQTGNHFCGENREELPILGKVTFKRVGGEVTLKAAVKHAAPNATYEVFLYGNGCVTLGEVAVFTTNSRGAGKGTGTISVGGAYNELFAAVDGGAQVNDTPYVLLPELP